MYGPCTYTHKAQCTCNTQAPVRAAIVNSNSPILIQNTYTQHLRNHGEEKVGAVAFVDMHKVNGGGITGEHQAGVGSKRGINARQSWEVERPYRLRQR